MSIIEFDGVAFDPIGAPSSAPSNGAPKDVLRNGDPAPAVPAESVRRSPGRSPIAEIRHAAVQAHLAALDAQHAIQRGLWLRARSQSSAPGATASAFTAGPAVAAPAIASDHGHSTESHAAEGSFKPLARCDRSELGGQDLQRLADGDIAGVFGAGHRRPGIRSGARIAAQSPLVLTSVSGIELYGGNGCGVLRAEYQGDPAAAATQAAEVFALFAGLHLAITESALVSTVQSGTGGSRSGTFELTVTEIDLVPRPHVVAEARTPDGARVVVTVTASVPETKAIGPGQVDDVLLLNEFHMAQLARGDQAIAMGPEFAPYTGVRATRLPTGGLLLVDRVLSFDGARRQLDSASYTTEYDSPRDSWYYRDTANESMPHFVYMETSLQAALLMGYYSGPSLTQPGVTLSLRNLGGSATIHRRVNLQDKTVRQKSRMLSTTILPGASLQSFDYELAVDGEPFYSGETMFGYFSDAALANQTGLDGGRAAPTWLAQHPESDTRQIDVAGRRADPAARLCARSTLALIDRITVVDGGGEHGAGYLHSRREIDPSDWYFDRHFHLDPVIPGSLGVESVVHAVQEWMIDAGHARGLVDPVFRIPAGITFSWRYRGQFLPTDGSVELEAHIKSVTRTEHGVVAVVDASLWKPGLRIYELFDLAVELDERKDLS